MPTYTPVFEFEKPEQDENYNVAVFNRNTDKVESALNARVETNDLAKVATSGQYGDLSGTPGAATTSTPGLMSTADKTKLNGIAEGANKYTHPSSHPASIITGLAAVATSGKYEDLSGRPIGIKSIQKGVSSRAYKAPQDGFDSYNIAIAAVADKDKCLVLIEMRSHVYYYSPRIVVTDRVSGILTNNTTLNITIDFTERGAAGTWYGASSADFAWTVIELE